MSPVSKGRRFLERRQHRIDRRRADILAAAAQVFAEKGYANTTTREIAEAAEVAEGTLYNYFDSKREILVAIAHETEAPMERAVMAANEIHDRAGMVALVEAALDIPEGRRSFMRAVLAEACVDDYILQEFAVVRLARIHRRLVDFLNRQIAAGTFRPVEPGLVAQMLMGMFVAVTLPVVRGVSEPESPERRHAVAEAMVDLLINGLSAHRG